MMNEQEKSELARGFYNDTYLTDQNAWYQPKSCRMVKQHRERSGKEGILVETMGNR